LNLHYRAAVRREMEIEARIIESVAIGYGGVKGGDKGRSTMQKILRMLRVR
jgi:hypothetical protein